MVPSPPSMLPNPDILLFLIPKPILRIDAGIDRYGTTQTGTTLKVGETHGAGSRLTPMNTSLVAPSPGQSIKIFGAPVLHVNWPPETEQTAGSSVA